SRARQSRRRAPAARTCAASPVRATLVRSPRPSSRHHAGRGGGKQEGLRLLIRGRRNGMDREFSTMRSFTGHAWRITLRTLQIVAASTAALLSFGVAWMRLRGSGDALPRAAGRTLVRLCTRLGATFIKVGQIASTRADLLPRPLVEELAALQDRVPPFPYEIVRRTIEEELGAPLERIYSQFDTEPVAAASVAQVHRAVLRAQGAVVAVKVRRPDIVEKVQLDRSILLVIARALERVVPSLRLVSLELAVRAFCDAVEEQIHFTQEAQNNARFSANFRSDPDIAFPHLYPAACSDAVLTMEFVAGVHEAELEAHGVDVHRVVVAGMRCVCRMI